MAYTPAQIEAMQRSITLIQQDPSILTMTSQQAQPPYTGYVVHPGMEWMDVATMTTKKYPPTTLINPPGRDPYPETRTPMYPTNFDCPVPGTVRAANALERMPRDPVVIDASVEPNQTVTVDADNAVGMYLCEIEANIVVDMETPDQAVIDAYREEATRLGRVSVLFRGDEVPGLNQIRLAEFIWNPECCGDSGVCIGAILPQFGALEIRLDDFPVAPPGVNPSIDFKIRANGCGCTCSTKAGCGCG